MKTVRLCLHSYHTCISILMRNTDMSIYQSVTLWHCVKMVSGNMYYQTFSPADKSIILVF